MSREDIEVLRRFTESLARGDLDGALECFHPEARFDWSESISPFRDIYVGREGMQRFWTESEETWDNFSPHIDEVIDCGEGRLLTQMTVSGRAQTSGIELEAHGTLLWTVQDGLIVAAKLFQTKADALDAAGRRP